MIEIGHELLDEWRDAMWMGWECEVLPDGEWIRAVKRRCERDDLFVYRHRVTKKFIVAQWLSKEHRVCQELNTLDLPPEQGGWIPLRVMELRCRPFYVHAREISDIKRTQRSEKRRMRESSALQKRDSVSYLRRKGMGAAADFLERGPGYVGDEEGGESLGMKKEELERLAAGRIISTH